MTNIPIITSLHCKNVSEFLSETLQPRHPKRSVCLQGKLQLAVVSISAQPLWLFCFTGQPQEKTATQPIKTTEHAARKQHANWLILVLVSFQLRSATSLVEKCLGCIQHRVPAPQRYWGLRHTKTSDTTNQRQSRVGLRRKAVGSIIKLACICLHLALKVSLNKV